MSAAAGASAGAAGAAAAARMRAEEEEEMTSYRPEDLAGYEFKILRSASGGFKNPAKLKAALEEEARAGWELVEKFDNGRVRLKRRLEWREKDQFLTQDPYRTYVGLSEGALAAWIVLGILGGLALVGLIAALVAALS